ncbi:class I SAM-dependent methyltransferase [Ferrovibrio sp.]|uniref:class I SAM-dependent methyltransferase n=1 Tax=Ferrovibrio sp. TaxID=1917215 RepID=UPI0035111C45
MGEPAASALPGRQSGRYWDAAASNWEDEIFSSFHNDRKGVIAAALKAAADPQATLADFGCGVGIYLPLLGRLFGRVHGFEQSAACVDVARRKVRRQRNVSVHVASRTARRWRGSFDAVLCANAAIHPRPAMWRGVLQSAHDLLRRQGRLILVVPALGSARLLMRAEAHTGDPSIVVGRDADGAARVTIDGVATKHYTQPELKRELAALGFAGINVRRIEYSWNCHGLRAPKALRGAKPWDWLVTAKA